MLFTSDYIDAAERQARKGMEMGGRHGAALIRLASQYLAYAANGLAPLPQAMNENAMGAQVGTPSGKLSLANLP